LFPSSFILQGRLRYAACNGVRLHEELQERIRKDHVQVITVSNHDGISSIGNKYIKSLETV